MVKKFLILKNLLITIKSWGPKIVVITDGADGAYAFDGKKIYYRKAQNIKGINTTGAGDSFCSAFIWALIKYNDLRLALAAGIINSNNVITEIGAENGLLEFTANEKGIKNMKKIKVPIEVSARHIHLSIKDAEKLFGAELSIA